MLKLVEGNDAAYSCVILTQKSNHSTHEISRSQIPLFTKYSASSIMRKSELHTHHWNTRLPIATLSAAQALCNPVTIECNFMPSN